MPRFCDVGNNGERRNGREWRSVRIGPVVVDDVTRAQLLDFLHNTVKARRSLRVFYANAHAVRLAAADPSFARELAHADVVFCDGAGVQLASHFLNTPLRARNTPPAWIDALISGLGSDARIYLVGDEAPVVKAAADVLRNRHLQCEVVGAQTGFFKYPGPEHDRIVADIRETAPTLVLVGMGMPRQEQWINRVAPNINSACLVAVGALFRRLSGHDRRPPRWIQSAGLEWLYRLMRDPVRLFDRYVIGLPKFALVIARQRRRDIRAR